MFWRLQKELLANISRTSALCILLMLKETLLCYCCSFCAAVSLMPLEKLRCLKKIPSARQGCSFLPSSLPRNLSVPSVSLHSGREIQLLPMSQQLTGLNTQLKSSTTETLCLGPHCVAAITQAKPNLTQPVRWERVWSWHMNKTLDQPKSPGSLCYCKSRKRFCSWETSNHHLAKV